MTTHIFTAEASENPSLTHKAMGETPMNKPFEVLRHSTDDHGKTIVDVKGTYLSNSEALKLCDELNRLFPKQDKLT